MKEVFSCRIFKEGLIPEVHASTVLKVDENKLLCAFFGGTKEGNDDVKIYLASFDGEKWSVPQVVASGENEACWNPVLLKTDEKITLFYKVGRQIPKWRTMYKTSLDGGETWSEEKELVEGDEGGRGPVKNKAIVLKNGKIVAPASVETPFLWDAFVDISSDSGKSWKKSKYVPFDHIKAHGMGVIQPTLWEDDKLYMLIRSTESRVMRSYSTDSGETWSRAEKTELLHNNSGIDCVKLPDGRVVVIYNPIPGNWADRNIIGFSMTDDNGESFSPCEVIEKIEDTEGEFSYPAVICDDKYVYLTYTDNRKNIVFRKFEI